MEHTHLPLMAASAHPNSIGTLIVAGISAVIAWAAVLVGVNAEAAKFVFSDPGSVSLTAGLAGLATNVACALSAMAQLLCLWRGNTGHRIGAAFVALLLSPLYYLLGAWWLDKITRMLGFA